MRMVNVRGVRLLLEGWINGYVCETLSDTQSLSYGYCVRAVLHCVVEYDAAGL
jgi:hypothetical protein